MRKPNDWMTLSVLALTLGVAAPAQAGGPKGADPALKARTGLIQEKLDADLDHLQTFYQYLHANPELSYEEVKTAARLTKELTDLGFEVTPGVGGHGLVGLYKNGPGPTVLVRTDMDALPVTEKTGVPYASKVRTRDRDGNDVGVMHACGHDMHMTCWLGTARALVRLKDRWRGTLMFIGQPAEEVGAGARKMLADGLFKRFPRPDYALGLHCDTRIPHGHVNYSESVLLANVDTVDVLVRGKGGHGAAPHVTIDPIVLAARIVVDLQTLVSREVQPGEPAVVTVGSFHGGTKHNIIPAEVKLQLTVRSLKDETRKHLLEGIARIVKAAAESARAPEPTIQVDLDNFTPALYNDAALARKLSGVFKGVLGDGKVHAADPIMGGEDFARYGREGVPIFFYFLGTMAPDRIEAARKGGPPLPGLHSDLYAPVPEPTIRAGVLTMTHAVLNLLANGRREPAGASRPGE